MSRVRSYRDLECIETFEERYAYLRLGAILGEATFGFDRWINQQFYRSSEWRHARSFVIARDDGCDLGVPGFEIHTGLYVHHMNPISPDDLIQSVDWILDPNFLITTSLRTHNAIHYGTAESLPREPVVRRPGDTTLW